MATLRPRPQHHLDRVRDGTTPGGILALRVGGLLFNRQALEVIEKRNKSRIQPCSLELLEALREMAMTSEGTRYTPGHADYDPNAPVFYYQNSTSEDPHPLCDRRFDTLRKRIQRSLPWRTRRTTRATRCATRPAPSLSASRARTWRARCSDTDPSARRITTPRRQSTKWRRRFRPSRAGRTRPHVPGRTYYEFPVLTAQDGVAIGELCRSRKLKTRVRFSSPRPCPSRVIGEQCFCAVDDVAHF